jgi:hypothetical protein
MRNEFVFPELSLKQEQTCIHLRCISFFFMGGYRSYCGATRVEYEIPDFFEATTNFPRDNR